MAGVTDTKLWDAVEDSREIREKEKTHRLDHPILSYMPNHLETLQTEKWEYLDNECTELDEQGLPKNGSVRGICGSESERRGAEMCENDPGITKESSSSSMILKRGERRVGETSEIRPQDDGGNSGQANKRGDQHEPQEGGRVLADKRGEKGITMIGPSDPELHTKMFHCPPNTKMVISQQRLHGIRRKRSPQRDLGEGNEHSEKR
ncbi:hypothetical protein BKA82DRAFT_4341016 [Pisolithus tinctorius]|nr:hypothetical protein BKA82DRAFT_4022148 [Pisolithus tinctorius]KAI6142041.1 hypothetical protein BKA82DRAFT_4018207 [Pisolithus tinctorius]KAI6143827.1 hypothetical protein BKA82DRAFT_4341016 [Pisolithus tinctorius]